MSVIDHLTELRYRLVICIASVVVGALVAYVFYEPLLAFIKHPIDTAGSVGEVKVTDLFVQGVATAFIFRLKVSAFAGFAFALPVVMFQLWRFVTPALDPREKRYAIPFVLSSLGLFAFGGFLAFKILPVAIEFLLGFVPPAQPLILLTEYLNFVIYMVLGFGLSFQFPLVLVSLAAVGLLDSRTLRKRRRMAILMAFILAALATPGGDPLSQTTMAVPLYILYELSILVIRYGLKR